MALEGQDSAQSHPESTNHRAHRRELRLRTSQGLDGCNHSKQGGAQEFCFCGLQVCGWCIDRCGGCKDEPVRRRSVYFRQPGGVASIFGMMLLVTACTSVETIQRVEAEGEADATGSLDDLLEEEADAFLPA